jgi:two-component system, response regulator YesN
MRNILIVDDSVLFRRLLKESLLAKSPSLVISEADNEEEALRIVLATHPDLVFMDVRLPHGNGFELTRLIKDLDIGIRVVILTSYDQPEYRDAAFRHKADHYVSKDSFMPLIHALFSPNPVGGVGGKKE